VVKPCAWWTRLAWIGVLAVLSLSLAAPSASACGIAPTDHCFGQVSSLSTPSGFLGARATIGPYCMSAPSGAAVTDEIWLGDSGQHWVEAGFVDNRGYASDLPSGHDLFWADLRPGYPYFEWPLLSNVNLSSRTISIQRTAPNTFTVHAGSTTAYSTSNSTGVRLMTVGSEIMTNSGSHSWAVIAGVGWWRSSGWVNGLPQPSVERQDPPGRWTWSTQFTAGHAGAPC
jgi:hypothetical protein